MKDNIKEIALRMARDIGVQNVTKSVLCREAKISEGSFNHIMGQSFTEFIGGLPIGSTRTITGKRVQPQFRKESILVAAVHLASDGQYATLSRVTVAEAAKVTRSLVYKYFPTMGAIREAVMLRAIAEEIPEIVLQGMAIKDHIAKAAPRDLKDAAIRILHRG